MDVSPSGLRFPSFPKAACTDTLKKNHNLLKSGGAPIKQITAFHKILETMLILGPGAGRVVVTERENPIEQGTPCQTTPPHLESQSEIHKNYFPVVRSQSRNWNLYRFENQSEIHRVTQNLQSTAGQHVLHR
jgi:hypothetical protein